MGETLQRISMFTISFQSRERTSEPWLLSFTTKTSGIYPRSSFCLFVNKCVRYRITIRDSWFYG